MKKLYLVSLALSSLALILSLIVFFRENKIVYVDSLKLITNYKGSKAAREAYEKKAAVWKANMDTLTMEFNRQAARFEKEKTTLTVKEKKLSEELLLNKKQQLDNYRQATAENASREDKEMTTRIFSEINDFLRQYGEKHGYEFIMAATNVGNIVFSKKENDVTEDVLKQLNEEYQSTHR